VGPKKAAEMLHRHGSLAGVLAGMNLNPVDRDYLQRAMKVVPPVTDIPLPPPAAAVPRAPADPAALETLKREFGLGGAVDRLLRVLAQA
jgi:hypothetical protein